MKNFSLIIYIISMLMLSCNNDNVDKEIGIAGNDPDEIKLSTKEVNFGISAGEFIVHTEGTEWMFDGFIDGKTYKDIYRASLGIDDTVHSYDWISVYKSGLNKIVINVDNNTTNSPRSIKLCVTLGNYFDYITITQEAE